MRIRPAGAFRGAWTSYMSRGVAMRQMSVYAVVVLLVVIGSLLAGCGDYEKGRARKPPASPRPEHVVELAPRQLA